jgi:hypothetical protein
MPSVFGRNNLNFTPSTDIFIENRVDYYNVIVREITKGL